MDWACWSEWQIRAMPYTLSKQITPQTSIFSAEFRVANWIKWIGFKVVCCFALLRCATTRSRCADARALVQSNISSVFTCKQMEVGSAGVCASENGNVTSRRNHTSERQTNACNVRNANWARPWFPYVLISSHHIWQEIQCHKIRKKYSARHDLISAKSAHCEWNAKQILSHNTSHFAFAQFTKHLWCYGCSRFWNSIRKRSFPTMAAGWHNKR